MFIAMFKLSTQILQSLQNHVFPPTCMICSDVIEFTQNARGCCQQCLKHIHIMPKDSCQSCGIAMPSSLAPGPCGKCLQHPLPQRSTSSLFVYKGAVRDALLAWKLQGQSSGIHWLLETAQPQLQQLFSPQDLLIPVPMPLNRMRRSGLHHTAHLCQMISKLTGATTDWRLLRRTKAHVRQSSLHGHARQNNLRKGFILSDDYLDRFKAHNVKGKIWVIDDILTTGATLRHACKAMGRTNRPVFAFSCARTLRD